MTPAKERIYGRNPILEASRAGKRRVLKLFLAKGVQAKGPISEILEYAEAEGIPLERVARRDLDRIHPSHQGIAAEIEPYPYASLSMIMDRARKSGEPPLVLLLDALQDPQNLGTLLRTAEAVGVHGVILPHRRAAGITPAVVRASAGASEHLLVALSNLARAIEELKKSDVWVMGLENSPQAKALGEVDLGGSVGLVVGSEGSGMRRLVRESCDLLIGLPMRGRITSLNAAVAGSIALYAILEARREQSEDTFGRAPDAPH